MEKLGWEEIEREERKERKNSGCVADQWGALNSSAAARRVAAPVNDLRQLWHMACSHVSTDSIDHYAG